MEIILVWTLVIAAIAIILMVPQLEAGDPRRAHVIFYQPVI